MKNKYIYITDEEWFESSTLANPITFLDHELEQYFPEFYKLDYDLKLLVTNTPANSEKAMPFYNDYRERLGNPDISVFESAARERQAKNVFLNGFHQEHIQYIAPFIKDTVEVLYLFKSPKIYDLSILSEFKQLKCVFIFWNNSLETLWDMQNNNSLKVISFCFVTKLRDIKSLKHSCVEYVTLDSMDNSGNKKELLFDIDIFDEMPKLKQLKLVYK